METEVDNGVFDNEDDGGDNDDDKMVKITLADDGDNIGGSNNVDSNDGVVYNIAKGDCGGHHVSVQLYYN